MINKLNGFPTICVNCKKEIKTKIDLSKNKHNFKCPHCNAVNNANATGDNNEINKMLKNIHKNIMNLDNKN